MIPRPATDDEAQAWATIDQSSTGLEVVMARTMMGGPSEGTDVIPCPTLITCTAEHTPFTWRVAYTLDEIELAALAQGGTLWLATWAQLPVHLLSVVQS